MSKMKSTLAATVITLILTVPALAGNIGTPGCTPPPPTACESVVSASSTGLVNILIAVLSLI